MVVATRPPKGYRWGEVTIQRWELVEGERAVRPTAVPALIHECGYLCLHKPVVEGFGLWVVSHVPTGQKIATMPTQAAGRECIGLLAATGHLASIAPSSLELSKAWTVVSSLQSRYAGTTVRANSRPSGKPPRKDSPSSFSPVFRGYVPTPKARAAANKAALTFGEMWNGSVPDATSTLSPIRAWNTLEEAATNKAALAFGEMWNQSSTTGSVDNWCVLEEAAAVQWREEIVVRVTQPPRALLLETDIPQRPEMSKLPSRLLAGLSTTLRDGTPATPGEFRRRYQQLMDLGDRLRAGSLKFQTLYREGEAAGWTTERLDRWERIDEKFRALVFEGWMVWSGAALCFDVAPAEFQRNVVKKLGYVGSRERGWHELGTKTFLRHPEIEEVLPLRREMREKIGARL